MAYPTVMTPELDARAWELLRANVSLKAAATALGVSEKAAGNWAKRNGVLFADGRSEARTPAQMEVSRAMILRANAASADKRRLPLDADERAAYQRYWVKARWMGIAVTRDDAFRAIGRPDLAQNTPGASSAPHGVRPSQAAAYRAVDHGKSAGTGTK